MVESAASRRTYEYDRVKTLYDYTKFHIGLYLTLGTILVAGIGAKTPVAFDHRLMWAAVVFIGFAGVAGGIVASTLPECPTLNAFFQSRTGPWKCKILRGRHWTYVEHTSFWIGIALAGISVALAPEPMTSYGHHLRDFVSVF